MDQVMADLATVESKYAHPKHKRDNEAKETPTSVLKHSDPSNSKYGPDLSNTIYGPALNNGSGNRTYHRNAQPSNDNNSRYRNHQNCGAHNCNDQSNRTRPYRHDSYCNDCDRTNVRDNHYANNYDRLSEQPPAYTKTSPG